MKKELFKELVASVQEGGAILRGETAPSRKFVIDKTDVECDTNAALQSHDDKANTELE